MPEVSATHIALLQCRVTKFVQRGRHSSVFYPYFCLFSNNNNTTDRIKAENRNCFYFLFSPKIWCKSVASSNRKYWPVSDRGFRMMKCAAKQHVISVTSVHKVRFGVGVTIWTVSPRRCLCKYYRLRRWRGTFFNLRYTSTCSIKPEDGIEKISLNVVSFQNSYNIRYTYWHTCEWKLANVFVWNTNDVGLFGT